MSKKLKPSQMITDIDHKWYYVQDWCETYFLWKKENVIRIKDQHVKECDHICEEGLPH